MNLNMDEFINHHKYAHSVHLAWRNGVPDFSVHFQHLQLTHEAASCFPHQLFHLSLYHEASDVILQISNAAAPIIASSNDLV